MRRFSEFQNGLGIAKGMLATRLRDLTERGILETAPASDGTAYREYVLTEKGRGLFLVIVALRQWGGLISMGRMIADLAWWIVKSGLRSLHSPCDPPMTVVSAGVTRGCRSRTSSDTET